ncbi:proline iminopeptidase [Actinokineospora diospyrosa]|uniref:Proline iminopeptidase n=1 Tax=Actinokineospora diospyrosa TaxID=103728 RepID=A0ABT1IFV8_9PSEU|nr:proline iminopeptidase [Actinokineospora diospyrosa]
MVRRVGAGAVAVVGLPLAAVAGLVGMVFAAGLSSWIALVACAGVFVFAGVAVLVGWVVFTVAGTAEAWRVAVGFGVLATVIAFAGGMVVFAPPGVPEPAAVPANVRFWHLPTGSHIAYVHAGGGGRPEPVVFLHGGPGTPAEGISPTGRALADSGFDVYAYDQVGAGRSTRLDDPTGYTVARHVADLEAIRVTLGAPRMILIGQSWGASLAAQYLAAHPDRVAKAVFSSPGELWPQAWPGGVGEPAADYDRVLSAESSPRLLLAAALLSVNPKAAHGFMSDAEADQRMREITLLLKDGADCPGSPPAPVHDNLPGFYANQRTAIDFKAIPDPRPALHGNPTPALVLRGSCDYIRPEVAAEYRTVFPNARLVEVPGAGHAIAHAQQARYQALVTEFLGA